MTEASPRSLPLPRRPGVHMVTSTGKHIRYFQVQRAFHGTHRAFLHISLLLSANDHLTALTFPPENRRWEGFSLAACSLCNRVPLQLVQLCPSTAWARQTSGAVLEPQDRMSHWLGNGDNLGTGRDLCWSASLLPKLMAGKWAPWPAERTACSLSSWLQGGRHC